MAVQHWPTMSACLAFATMLVSMYKYNHGLDIQNCCIYYIIKPYNIVST
jgi:hypothetical protein